MHGGYRLLVSLGLSVALLGHAGAQDEKEEIFEPASVNVPAITEVEWAWIEMYGVRLNSATREPMRRALHAHGVKAVREDGRVLGGCLRCQRLMPGASQFYVGYTAASQQLAFAEYAFHSFMDSSHTQKIVSRVTAKYGPPYETAGQLAMGAYTARWRMSDGMQIQVVREWPETSTYLKFINPAVDLEMKAELDKEINAREKSKFAEGAPSRPMTPAGNGR